MESGPTATTHNRLRLTLKPYIRELAVDVTKHGVPTMQPLWWESPADTMCVGVSLGDQYLLGAPVTTQNVTDWIVCFPAVLSVMGADLRCHRGIRWYTESGVDNTRCHPCIQTRIVQELISKHCRLVQGTHNACNVTSGLDIHTHATKKRSG